MSVRVHIDRLVVDAGAALDPAALESAVATALSSGLAGAARPGWWQAGSDQAALAATLPRDGLTLGERIGTAVAASLAAGPAKRTDR